MNTFAAPTSLASIKLNLPTRRRAYYGAATGMSRGAAGPSAAEAKGLGPDSPIVLICRGDRSAAAANLLAEAGLKNVYSAY